MKIYEVMLIYTAVCVCVFFLYKKQKSYKSSKT